MFMLNKIIESKTESASQMIMCICNPSCALIINDRIQTEYTSY